MQLIVLIYLLYFLFNVNRHMRLVVPRLNRVLDKSSSLLEVLESIMLTLQLDLKSVQVLISEVGVVGEGIKSLVEKLKK